MTFTGTWLIINDLKRVLDDGETASFFKRDLKIRYGRLRFQRVIGLLAGMGVIVLYFFDRNMNWLIAIIFIAYFFRVLNYANETREKIRILQS